MSAVGEVALYSRDVTLIDFCSGVITGAEIVKARQHRLMNYRTYSVMVNPVPIFPTSSSCV